MITGRVGDAWKERRPAPQCIGNVGGRSPSREQASTFEQRPIFAAIGGNFVGSSRRLANSKRAIKTLVIIQWLRQGWRWGRRGLVGKSRVWHCLFSRNGEDRGHTPGEASSARERGGCCVRGRRPRVGRGHGVVWRGVGLVSGLGLIHAGRRFRGRGQAGKEAHADGALVR